MFCRKCGTENYPGQDFCVNCGSPLENSIRGNYRENANYSNSEKIGTDSTVVDILKNGIERRKLKSITIVLVIILLGIALYFPGRMIIGQYNAGVENEFQISTVNQSLFETDSCVYYAGDDYLYRVYKDNGGNEKIINKSVEIIGGASDRIYFKDQAGTVYSVKDDKSDSKEIKNISKLPYSGSFISGRYTYTVTGMNVMKQMNSNVATASTDVYVADNDEFIEKAIKCGNYMYMMVSSENHGINSLIRLDLRSSKTEILFDSINDFSMTDKNIACLIDDSSAVVMDIDGKNQNFIKSGEFNQLEKVICLGDTVYCYDYWGDWCAFDIETQKSKELYIDDSMYNMEAGLSTLVYKYNDTLYICNSSGTVISYVEL